MTNKQLHLFIFLLLCSFSINAQESKPHQNVILITLDGVRYHEIFDGIRKPCRAGEARGTPIMPDVLKTLSEEGFIFGNRTHGEPTMSVSNRAGLSQPGYRAILSGQFEKVCRNNKCPMIDHETIFDRLMDEGAMAKEVAAFSSWDVLDLCLESKGTRAVRSVSFNPIQGLTPTEAAPFISLQEIANNDRPHWGGSRWDKYTFEMGMLYLKTHRPRFLYMMLVDPDEHAHHNNYVGYVQSLRDFNERFMKLVQTLKAMDGYGEETSIVVTTDHGRGRGSYLWQKHSREWFDSMRIWSFVLPSEGLRKRHAIVKRKSGRYQQIDVRPTVELLLGIAPRSAVKGRGAPLIEIR